jgi:DNA mismatch repair protein PMS2
MHAMRSSGQLDLLHFYRSSRSYQPWNRFETLQRTTVIQQQLLLTPLILESSAAEEEIIKSNLSIFESNGFRLRYKDDENVAAGRRIEILSLPYSKDVEFGIKDVHELASMLMDHEDGVDRSDANGLLLRNSALSASYIVLPKIMSMHASRACRSAVMIGSALHGREMRKIVDQLATLNQPWNCPHGRPTMRLLAPLPAELATSNDSQDFYRYDVDVS